MVFPTAGMAQPPTDDALAHAIHALREIYAGASATGRWYCNVDHKPAGHDPAQPNAGYYDGDDPPAGYDAEGWAGISDCDEEPADLRKPCEWEDFTLEEQSCWLDTCACTARDALEKLGVPVADIGG